MGAKAGSGVFPFPLWEEQSSGPWQCLSCSRAHSCPRHQDREEKPQLGQEFSREGKEPFPFLEVSHTHCPVCTCPWSTWRVGTDSQTRGCCTNGELLPPAVSYHLCSESNYLNIFTGDEGNEGAKKRGMGGKNSFSNCNEVIKKTQETGTLFCTVSLPLPPRFH